MFRQLFALAALFVVTGACGGQSTIEGDDESAAGEAGETGNGGASKGGSSTGGASAGGSSSGGIAGVGGLDPCAGKQCGEQCSYECPPSSACDPVVTYCDANGTCSNVLAGPHVCPVCLENAQCPAPPIECVTCDDGTTSCPSPECYGGKCLLRWSSCIGIDPCAGLDCGAPCNPCNGSLCPPMELPYLCNVEGKCTNEPSACLGECNTSIDCPPPPPSCGDCPPDTCLAVDCINGFCEWLCR